MGDIFNVYLQHNVGENAEGQRDKQAVDALAHELRIRTFSKRVIYCESREHKEQWHDEMVENPHKHRRAKAYLEVLHVPIFIIEETRVMEQENCEHTQHAQPVNIIVAFFNVHCILLYSCCEWKGIDIISKYQGDSIFLGCATHQTKFEIGWIGVKLKSKHPRNCHIPAFTCDRTP